VTVATVEPIAVELTRHLVALRRAHPAIQVHLHVTDAFVDLSRHEADLALRATREPPEDLVGQRVVFRTSSRAAFVEIVAAGAAMGVLPCGLAGDLVPLTEPIAALRLPLWLLAHPDLASSPRIRVVRGFLLAAFEGRRPALEGEGVRPR
jgi:DNA-binding transcriptional LysR family regulator